MDSVSFNILSQCPHGGTGSGSIDRHYREDSLGQDPR